MINLDNKEAYSQLCKSEDSIPIFSQNWWLDVVSEDGNWDVAIAKKGDNIIGSLPYCISRGRYGRKHIAQPVLTQKLGPWINYPKDLNDVNRLSFEKKVMDKLIDQIPSASTFAMNFDHSVSNWLPFYWRGFTQTTFYTYIIDLSFVKDDLLSSYRSNIRREIKKAQKIVDVSTGSSAKEFYIINKKTFDRQNLQMRYSEEFLVRLDAALEQRDQRRIYLAKDAEGRVHAGIYVIWDSDCAYYLMGGADPDLRNSGATSLLMHTAISEMSNIVRYFDFEGSMIKSVERYFAAFGSTQTPYFHLTKSNNKTLRSLTAAIERLSRL